jgi:hypothetical protein
MPASLAKLPQVIAAVRVLFTPIPVWHVLDPVSGVQGTVVEGLDKASGREFRVCGSTFLGFRRSLSQFSV